MQSPKPENFSQCSANETVSSWLCDASAMALHSSGKVVGI